MELETIVHERRGTAGRLDWMTRGFRQIGTLVLPMRGRIPGNHVSPFLGFDGE